MKLKKLSNATVILLDDSNRLVKTFPSNWSIQNPHPELGKLYITSDGIPDIYEEGIKTADITALVINDVETAFTGNTSDLAIKLATDFFIKATDLGGLLPLNSTIGAFGDSITGYWMALVSAIRSNYQNNGFMLFANIKTANKFYMPIGGSKGIAGNSTADMLARLGTVTALQLNVVSLMGGTNDLVASITSATTINNLKLILAALLSSNSRVYFWTILPRFGANALTGPQEIKRQEVNTWIRSQGNSNVKIMDAELILTESLTVDGLHPNSLGAAALGNILGVELEKIIKPGKVIDVLSADNSYNSNLYFTGTAGVKTNGSLGTVASSYELDRSANFSGDVTGSIVTAGVTNSQKIDLSGSYIGTGALIALKNNTTLLPPVTGDIIEAMAEIEIVVNNPNIVGININFNVYTSAFASLARADSYIALDKLSNSMSVGRYVLRTPSVAVGAGTATRVACEVNIIMKDQTVATPVSASIIVHRIGARKVPAYYNQVK